jgi:hypothetical protein
VKVAYRRWSRRRKAILYAGPMAEDRPSSRIPMAGMPIYRAGVEDRMTRLASSLLLVALLVCGAATACRADEPRYGHGAAPQPFDLARQPVVDNDSAPDRAPPRRLQCRRYFGCTPILTASGRNAKGIDHD